MVRRLAIDDGKETYQQRPVDGLNGQAWYLYSTPMSLGSQSSTGSAAVNHLPRFLMRTFIIVAIASVVLLVIAEVGLGWSLDAAERSFVVLIVLLITVGGTWIRNRLIGGKDDKT